MGDRNMAHADTTPSVVVVGSANVDFFFKTDSLPSPGETVIASAFNKSYGGKGANQAVTVSRLGGRALMLCRVGGDASGNELLVNFDNAGVDTEYIIRDPKSSSGMAFITVDRKGENTIVIFSGANMRLSPSDLQGITDEIRNAKVVVSQLEIPIQTVRRTAEVARDKDALFILNPAPAPSQDISDILRLVDILCPNRRETESLTGVRMRSMDDARRASDRLRKKGVKRVVLTLGAEGAFLANEIMEQHIPCPPAAVRDTTGAGDAFVGALAYALASRSNMVDAVQFANVAAAISVTKDGTQTGLPTLDEIRELYRTFYS
jgi:ribokinase